MRCFITFYLFPLYFLLISYFSSSSIVIEASPVSDTTLLWSHTEEKPVGNHPHLSKRITSIFPNTGHGSTTFNVIHVIAAVIGIIGATILLIVLAIYYKRKRRRLIAEQQQTAAAANQLHHPHTRSPYGLPITSSSASFDHSCRSSFHPQSFIPSDTLSLPNNSHHHRKPSSTMSQFQVFQSDYYYDDEKQNLQSEKLIQHHQPSSSSSSSSTTPYNQFILSSPPQCHHPYTSSPTTTPSSPPPYKP